MIGVNNLINGDSPNETRQGGQAVIHQIQKKYPNAKILLNAFLPFKATKDNIERRKVLETNAIIAKFDQLKGVHYFDFGALFLDQHGTIPKELMNDFLHPTVKGIALWGEQRARIFHQYTEKTALCAYIQAYYLNSPW